MTNKRIKIYTDGFSIRLKNRRCVIRDINGFYFLEFCSFDNKEANSPAVKHKCIKGKIRVSLIKLSDEFMEGLVLAFLNYKKNKK